MNEPPSNLLQSIPDVLIACLHSFGKYDQVDGIAEYKINVNGVEKRCALIEEDKNYAAGIDTSCVKNIIGKRSKLSVDADIMVGLIFTTKVSCNPCELGRKRKLEEDKDFPAPDIYHPTIPVFVAGFHDAEHLPPLDVRYKDSPTVLFKKVNSGGSSADKVIFIFPLESMFKGFPLLYYDKHQPIE